MTALRKHECFDTGGSGPDTQRRSPGPLRGPVEMLRRVCEQRRPAVSCLVLASSYLLVLLPWLGPLGRGIFAP